MTQDDYTLYTGQTVNYSQEDWERLVTVASERLASLLCLDELPDPLPGDLAMLLANFICGIFRYKGDGTAVVTSKSVRNFSVSLTQPVAKNVFDDLRTNYADIIGKYSQCGIAVDVERSCSPYWRCGCDCL